MRQPEWSDLAEAIWRTLPRAEQELVSKAVERYARTGEGDLEHISKEDGTARLYVGQLILMLGLPPQEEGLIVEVLWLYRMPQ